MNLMINKDNAGWIVDSIHEDFKKFTRHNIVNSNPDIFFSISFWGFKKTAHSMNCPSIAMVHHINEPQISEYPFDYINQHASACIVPNKITADVLKRFIKKPIHILSYWLLSDRMKPKINIELLKNTLSPNGEILMGYFQKDSNRGGATPKLCKGPDIFFNIVKELNKSHKIKVVLTGYDRKWIINQLFKENIPYVYYEKVKDINKFYDVVDWYFVTSRIEGGPQAVMEASYRKIKILSTSVGLAPDVLHPDCICKTEKEFIDKFNSGINRIEENYKNVQEYLPQKVIKQYDEILESYRRKNDRF